MKGTIADIRMARLAIAASGKAGVKLPSSWDIEVITEADSPDGLGPGQLDLEE